MRPKHAWQGSTAAGDSLCLCPQRTVTRWGRALPCKAGKGFRNSFLMRIFPGGGRMPAWTCLPCQGPGRAAGLSQPLASLEGTQLFPGPCFCNILHVKTSQFLPQITELEVSPVPVTCPLQRFVSVTEQRAGDCRHQDGE